MWFVILSGVREHTPLNRVWFLRADTSGIAGSKHPVSQWTFFKICGEFNRNCDKSKAALPLGYAWYDDSTGAPRDLAGNHGHNTTSRYYFYMWRFGWVFYFIAFILANIAVLFGLLACLKIVTVATGLITLSSLFFLTLAACLMTFVLPLVYSKRTANATQRRLHQSPRQVQRRRPRRKGRSLRLRFHMGLGRSPLPLFPPLHRQRLHRQEAPRSPRCTRAILQGGSI